MRKSKAFLYNALLLVAVSLIMRTVGIYFNVYISNRIGAVAMGVYSLVGGIYGFGITLATSGVNLAVTRLVSEALGREQPGEIRRIMSRCVIYASSFGLLAAVLLLTLSETIAYS
ncbi:MAG TPA: MATE family efflux transporter, partial [Bacillota bacterium]|nr:MATE family efflux transporter [Bacillota bacterium]